MTSVSPQEVRAFVLETIEESLQANGVAAQALPDDFDLLLHGGIGSFGFLRVITSLQEKFGVELDLEQLDPEQAKILGPLCQYISDCSKNGGR
jgi:acyl carrier protein